MAQALTQPAPEADDAASRSATVRFQIDLPRAQAERFDALMRECELGTRKELFNTALTLFSWAVREVRKGRSITSYDERSESLEKVLLPGLAAVAARGEEAAG